MLWVGDVSTGVWSIDVDDQRAWPVYRRYEDLESDFVEGSVRILKSLNTFLTKLLPDDAYLKKHAERADKNYAVIAPLVEEDDPSIYERKRRGRKVADLAKRSGCRKALIYSNLRHYWQGGCIPYAVLPEYFRIGQVKNPPDQDRKVGRPSKNGRKVTAKDKKLFQRGIDDFKKTGIAKKLTKVWELTLGKYFNTGYEKLSDGTLVPIIPRTANAFHLINSKIGTTRTVIRRPR